MDDFWATIFKEMTEPYMSKYQREQVYNKIKRLVFEHRSAQIKRAKHMGKKLNQSELRNPFAMSRENMRTFNAYNLDNNDLDYIVYK